MKRIKTGTKGPQGEARVRVGNGKVQIKFRDEKLEPVVFPKSELPDYVKPGTFFVSLSGEGEFVGMRPVNAIAKVKFAQFAAEEGEVPTPKEYPGGIGKKRDGGTFSYDAYRAFIAILEIVQPDYKGMTVPVFLRYLFVDDGEGNIAIKGGGKNADLLESFLEVGSVIDDEIPFSENVLPKLQKRLQKRGAEFLVMLKNGYVDSFMESPDEDGDDGDDDDDDWISEPDDEVKITVGKEDDDDWDDD